MVPSLLPRDAGWPASPWVRSPSRTPVSPARTLPVLANWSQNLAPPVASASSTSGASGTPTLRAPAWVMPLGVGPQPFWLLSLCLERVSALAGALPGKDLGDLGGSSLLPVTKSCSLPSQVSWPHLSLTWPLPEPTLPTQRPGVFLKHSEVTSPSCSLPCE